MDRTKLGDVYNLLPLLGKSIDKVGGEEGLRGLNRYKQLLSGKRVRKLKNDFEQATTQAERERILHLLKKEDLTHLAVGLGSLYAGSIALGEGIKKVTNKAGKIVQSTAVSSWMDDNDIPRHDKKGNRLEFKDRWALMKDKKEWVGAKGEIIDRTLLQGDETDKLTLRDVGSVGGGALGAYLSSKAFKPAFPRLIGTGIGWHGTRKGNAESILQNGLDPSYGATKGGQTRIIARKGNSSVPILSINNEISVPTRDLIDNAIGRTYIAQDGLGHAAAIKYAYENMDDAERANLWKILEDRKFHTIGGQIRRTVDPIAITNDIRALGKAHGTIINKDPKKTYVMGITMPWEQMQQRFEPDPDDITYGGSGSRTRRGEIPKLGYGSLVKTDDELDDFIKHNLGNLDAKDLEKIDPKHISAGSPGWGKIWKNRTKDFAGYLKNPGGRARFATGLGLAGLGAAGTYISYREAKPGLTKIKDKAAEMYYKRKEKQQKP